MKKTLFILYRKTKQEYLWMDN